LETVSPIALQVALSVQDELLNRATEADDLRKKHVERARYEAELARRRYMQVDPENRLVACSLEAEWNEQLRHLTEAQKEYEAQKQMDELVLSEERRKEILALSSDFPRLWNDSKTPAKERKRLVRLIIEDVTLRKDEHQVSVEIRFKGGAARSLKLPRALGAGIMRKTPLEVVNEIDRLLERHGHAEIAELLNKNGFRSGEGQLFNKQMISHISQNYNLKERRERERERGLLTREAVSNLLRVSEWRVTKLYRQGYLRKCAATRSGREMYEPPTDREIEAIRNIPACKTGRPRKSIFLSS